MLRLPRQAHYSICEKLCARDTARLIATASQWYREDDPRRAAFFACLADRVERARAVESRRYGRHVVPGKTIASMLEFLEAVERRDWEITPTGRDGDCSGQLRAGRRNSIVCSRYPNMNILRINDCHVWTLRCHHWVQVAGGHPVLEPLQCAKMEVCSARRLWFPIDWSLTDSDSSSSSSSEDY